MYYSPSVIISSRASRVDQFLLWLRTVRLCVLGRLLGCLACVELLYDLGVDSVELLLREDAQQIPGKIQRVEDAPRFVGTCPRSFN